MVQRCVPKPLLLLLLFVRLCLCVRIRVSLVRRRVIDVVQHVCWGVQFLLQLLSRRMQRVLRQQRLHAAFQIGQRTASRAAVSQHKQSHTHKLSLEQQLRGDAVNRELEARPSFRHRCSMSMCAYMCVSSVSIPSVCCTAMSILRISDVCVSMRMPTEEEDDCSETYTSHADRQARAGHTQRRMSARDDMTRSSLFTEASSLIRVCH